MYINTRIRNKVSDSGWSESLVHLPVSILNFNIQFSSQLTFYSRHTGKLYETIILVFIKFSYDDVSGYWQLSSKLI